MLQFVEIGTQLIESFAKILFEEKAQAVHIVSEHWIQSIPYAVAQFMHVVEEVLKNQSTQVDVQAVEFRPEHATQFPPEGTYWPFVQFDVLSITQLLLTHEYVAQTEALHSKESAWLQLKARDWQVPLLTLNPELQVTHI